MKTLFACGLVAGLTATMSSAEAAPKSPFPTNADREICDPIFARLAEMEQGVLMAQAPEPTPPHQSTPAGEDDAAGLSEGELATELSAMLQACSYEGKALAVDPKALTAPEQPGGVEAVGAIMRFTGLPQNFRIMEGEVPNAAAMIVLGPDGIPQRVIAYNAGFMEEVRTATRDNNWSPLSIMAHEIGHHLSGHTMVPGGSQPPTELEADTFSGFVLFKMGAALPDAQIAIRALIPEADGPTHPGRAKRLAAIEAGWTRSCEQQGGPCDGAADVAVAAVEAAPAVPAAPAPNPAPQAGQAGMPDIPGAGQIMMPDEARRMREADAGRQSQIDRMPRLSAEATPAKFDRFVYDELGIFGPSIRDRLQDTAFRFAAAANVEIVTIVARDLQGRTADEYALDAMRQLRVGKLDVGNGAVLVVAPDAGQAGVALGPGLLVQYDTVEPLRTYLQSYIDLVAAGAQPRAASQMLADAAYRIMRDARALEWDVRYGTLDAMTEQTGSTARRLVAVDATIVSTAPDRSDTTLGINEPMTRHTGPALHARTPGGQDLILYVNPNVPALMPVPLEEGQRYRFIARNSLLIQDTPQLDLISYDLLQ
ncbi:TPM domain-containing protein [Aureimonas altamirensis]|uniref:TPM domain-containing protein n=1 Tax=Aureimonas altamirensis TaxID=370622 RepID=UPI001E3FFB3A|nr:TPM domain-containing protein [Aureimonas altamirensis]UHD47022.1 TPM domain-containing protein [Aureimonas altamirensis]